MQHLCTHARAVRIGLMVMVTALTTLSADRSHAATSVVAVLDFGDLVTSGLEPHELDVLTELTQRVFADTLDDRFTLYTLDETRERLRPSLEAIGRCESQCEAMSGRRIGATMVVSGNVVQALGGWQVNVDLIKTSDGDLLMSGSGRADSALGLSGEVERVTRTLASKLASRSKGGEVPSKVGDVVPEPWHTNPIGWSLVGVGAAMAVASTAMFVLEADTRQEAQCNPATSQCGSLEERRAASDQANTYKIVSLTMLGVGAGALVGGIVTLAVMGDGWNVADAHLPSSDGLRLQAIAPVFTPERAGVGASFSF